MSNIFEQIAKISEFTGDYNMAIYKLGIIHGMASQAIAERNDRKEISDKLVSNTNREIKLEVSKTEEFPKKASEITSKVVTPEKNKHTAFEQLAIDMTPKKPCTDVKNGENIANLMERVGDHRNLKFEVEKRWINKTYAKTVMSILAQFNITTMSDFLKIFDDYENYVTLRWFDSQSAERKDKLLKVFPLRDFNEQDRNKFYSMYDAMNEHPDGNRTDEDILTELVNGAPVTGKNGYVTRYYNALVRYGICNIHQLYVWLNTHDAKELTGFRGIGHVADSIRDLADYAKANPIK